MLDVDNTVSVNIRYEIILTVIINTTLVERPEHFLLGNTNIR